MTVTIDEEAGLAGSAIALPHSPDFEVLFSFGLSGDTFNDEPMGRLFEVGRQAYVDQAPLPIEYDVIAHMAGVDLVDVQRALALALSPRAAIRIAREIVARRERMRLVESLAQVNRDLAGGGDLADARAAVERLLAEPDRSTIHPSYTITDAIDSERPYDWVIPDFLERGNRLLVTATEGAGKTELLMQIAMQAAVGVHPWWPPRQIEPVNTLYVDLELGHHAVARRMARLARAAGVKDTGRLRWVSKPGGIDLLAGGAAFLATQLANHPAELLCLGPLYQAYGPPLKGDAGGEAQAKQLAYVLDRLVTRFGVALVMETHAPHAGDGRFRNLRPFGSSVWLRWPDFGIGLYPDDDSPAQFNLSHWRGPRDDRYWPDALTRGSKPWSWEPYWPDGNPFTPHQEEAF